MSIYIYLHIWIIQLNEWENAVLHKYVLQCECECECECEYEWMWVGQFECVVMSIWLNDD